LTDVDIVKELEVSSMENVMVKKKSSLPSLPEAELDVLSCILQRQRVTAREIREALTDVAFVYQATRKPGSVYQSLVQNLLDRVFAGDGLALVHSLFETQPPNPHELEELQTMLDTMRARKKQGAGK